MLYVPRVLPERVWKLEAVVRLAGLIFLGIFFANLMMKAAGDQLFSAFGDKLFVQHVVSFLFLQGLALVWISLFLREHQTNWIQGFGMDRSPGFSIGMGLLTMVVALPMALVIIGSLVVYVLKQFGITPEAQHTVTAIKEQSGTLKTVVLGFAAIVLAPAAEETIFRGILYPTIKQRGHPHWALWGTSILFGLIHGNVSAFIPLTFLALVFTWLYERTGNLLAPIAAHSAFNAFNFWALVNPPPWLEQYLNQ